MNGVLQGKKWTVEELPYSGFRTKGSTARTIHGIGCQSGLLAPSVAIIGARNATPYGKRAAFLVAGWAADLGYTVVSGGARGCDQAAHRGALAKGGKTVAVMGCGADVIYPSKSGKLFQEIIDNGGAIVSEFDWSTPPMKYRFNSRNKTIAEMVDLVVVVEARLPSGSLSTVGHAVNVGTPIAAVPGSILCIESEAPNRLISEGASIIASSDDLALALGITPRPLTVREVMEGVEKEVEAAKAVA